MSKIAYTWRKGAPPAPDVYVTRRNESEHLVQRYWGGESWFEIAYTGSRGGTPFKWPKPSRTKLAPMARFYKDSLHLRKISAHLREIQWGEPYKVFDEKEVLKHLVATNRLPANWRECYQEEMRAEGQRELQKTLTNEQIVAELTRYGINFQWFINNFSQERYCGLTAGSQSVPKLCDGVRAIVAAGKTRIELLEDLADEYDRLVRHMDAGGDFTAFQVAEARRRNGESAEQETLGEPS